MNLPYVALLSKENHSDFYEELGKACDLAFKGNMFRIERMKGTQAKVSPILWQYGGLATLKPEDIIDHLFYGGNATCSIGYGGLAESLDVLGDTSKNKGLEVISFLKNKTEEYTNITGISFSVYGTPLESGAYKFAESIKESFPWYTLGRDYVTNSFHITPSVEIDMEDKFESEGDFYLLSSGGNVNNIEIPNLSHNIEALESVIKLAYGKVNYLICNQPIDKCFECGYSGEFVAGECSYSCPVCENGNPETTNCIKRISGYIHNATARPANKGKFAEQKERVKNMK